MILKSMSRSQRGRFVAVTKDQWIELRALAIQHGWKPCGTIDPGLGLEELKNFEKRGWMGGYDCPSFQKATEGDAYALSDCLASALQYYVDSKSLLENEFSTLNQDIVSQVKEFCSLGSFRILPENNKLA
ncbi:MAG TPA: hypothetical protein EYN87_03665 [Gammaproteobacteria bacterium]|nr:hypothetical protein [Gammaproteobacteria bacterium]HIC21524.1 hypothetical protein [Gammaproteobacteria bacterium]